MNTALDYARTIVEHIDSDLRIYAYISIIPGQVNGSIELWGYNTELDTPSDFLYNCSFMDGNKRTERKDLVSLPGNFKIHPTDLRKVCEFPNGEDVMNSFFSTLREEVRKHLLDVIENTVKA